MADDRDMKRLRKLIHEELRARRPDRYLVRDRPVQDGGEDDDEPADLADLDSADDGTKWLDDLEAEIESQLPEATARKHLARNLVRQAEGRATRSGNTLLRRIQIAKRDSKPIQGFLPLEEFYADPIAIVIRSVRDGKVRVREERVALRAATPDDFKAFANHERRRAGKDHAARIETCEGAEYVAEQMQLGGFIRFDKWADNRKSSE
jgi:hypothetical protein